MDTSGNIQLEGEKSDIYDSGKCTTLKNEKLCEKQKPGRRIKDLKYVGYDGYSPAFPQYRSCDARLWTFTDWPKFHHTSPQNLAEAGFYYTEYSDRVCCFYCGIVLKDWEEKDCPWHEHYYWSPFCTYIQSVKAQPYTSRVFKN